MYKNRYGSVAPTQAKFEDLKGHYINLRDNFRNDPRSSIELEAWKSQRNDVEYPLLNANNRSFIPAGLVGKGAPGFPLWEYPKHNKPDLVLSESTHSYIIGNVASYDRRQYPSASKEKRPEGQGFCHTLVIPKSRIYNVVDPEATAQHCYLLKEMRAHFIDFWTNGDGKQKILARSERALDDQDQKLRSSPDGPEYEKVRGDVYDHFETTKVQFEKLKAEEDFVFGFHVFPDNSIGHLHMHIFPHAEAFREFSARVYDYKTVPLQAILEAEAAEE
ncbi:MAG: hypothetical protein Q9174_007022 [Haloplaca sp. 1 TL-2023]